MPAKSNRPMRAEAAHSPAVNLKKDVMSLCYKNKEIGQLMSLLIVLVALFADGGVVTIAAVVFIIGLGEG